MTTPALDFTPSVKKIKRAERKLAHLHSMICAYAADNPYSMRTELHDGMFHVIARRDKPVPEDIGWEIVEAVGHLRSALDKMMVALVALNGNGLSQVGFPFGGMNEGKPQIFPDGRTIKRLEKKLTPEQFALVIAQKPYPGGNDLLWSLNEIANEDKHSMDLVSADVVAHPTEIKISNAVITGGDCGICLDPARYRHVLANQEAETIVVSYGTGPAQPDIKCEFTLGIFFRNVVPVQGQEVRATLVQQIGLVKGIVELFRSAFA